MKTAILKQKTKSKQTENNDTGVSTMKMKSLMIVGILGTGIVFTSQAAIITFDTGQGNNADLSSTFGTDLSADIPGASISNGATPNIGLIWSPGPNVWEVHGGAGFAPVGDGQVAQLDLNGGEADPIIFFNVQNGVRLGLNSLEIGHATDMFEADHAWTLTLTEYGGLDVFTHTTALLGPGDTEIVNFDFTGSNSQDYFLTFDDGGADHVRAGIDNLSFNQYGRVIPEPSTFMLTGLGVAMLLRRRRSCMENGGR